MPTCKLDPGPDSRGSRWQPSFNLSPSQELAITTNGGRNRLGDQNRIRDCHLCRVSHPDVDRIPEGGITDRLID